MHTSGELAVWPLRFRSPALMDKVLSYLPDTTWTMLPSRKPSLINFSRPAKRSPNVLIPALDDNFCTQAMWSIKTAVCPKTVLKNCMTYIQARKRLILDSCFISMMHVLGSGSTLPLYGLLIQMFLSWESTSQVNLISTFGSRLGPSNRLAKHSLAQHRAKDRC